MAKSLFMTNLFFCPPIPELHLECLGMVRPVKRDDHATRKPAALNDAAATSAGTKQPLRGDRFSVSALPFSAPTIIGNPGAFVNRFTRPLYQQTPGLVTYEFLGGRF